MKVRWHDSATADLVDLTTFIASENPRAARRILEEIERQIDLLADYPELGRAGRMLGSRERAVTGTPFIVVYQVGTDVTVLRILHGARRWPS